jgi:restriction system protein
MGDAPASWLLLKLLSSEVGPMARKSSLWSEIARDREHRRKEAERQHRLQRQIVREVETDAFRERQVAERAEKTHQKEIAEEQRRRRLEEAAEQTTRLDARVQELEDLLKSCLEHVPLTAYDLTRPVIPTFEPGEDGLAHPAPRPPVVEVGGFLGRGHRRREAAAAMALFEVSLAEHRDGEQARLTRLEQRRTEHERHVQRIQAEVRQRSEELAALLDRGDEETVEQFCRAAIETLRLPEGIELAPRAVYRPEPREVVVDLRLPDFDIVPEEKSVRYVHTRESFNVKRRSRAEVQKIYLRLLAQIPLCVLRALFGAMDPNALDSVTVNGILPARDPETGQPATHYLVSVTTSRATFDGLVLSELDPVRCIRYLGAKLSSHPLDLEEIAPFLTFDLAKYRLAASVDVAAGLDSTTNLLEIEWGDFEQLVRQLLHEMNGGDARVTRRSRDDGIDGVLFDCNAVLGGEYIVQAKRYKRVVPANDVRALAGVLHDKRANHAVFVTPSWFSDDGRRFAADNRVRLIERPELKQLLHQHLKLQVIIPLPRQRVRKNS